jgi:hypothetical protein
MCVCVRYVSCLHFVHRYLLRLPCYATPGPMAALPKGRVALYTLVQCTLVALCWAVTLSPFALAFPFVIGKSLALPLHVRLWLQILPIHIPLRNMRCRERCSQCIL